jgi:putative chitinase
MRFDARLAQTRLCQHGYQVAVDGDFGPSSWAALLAFIGRKPVGDMHRALGQAADAQFFLADIDTGLRVAHCLAQSCTETGGFTKLVESLNYSVEGLLGTFGRHRISGADAQRLGRKPGETALSIERQNAIADIVYGGGFGRTQLGNIEPGDGSRFKGRGCGQTTGRANYAELQRVTGLNVLEDPDQLADPLKGMKAWCVFWTVKHCNALADADDVLPLRKRVNGGTNGLEECRVALTRAKMILI